MSSSLGVAVSMLSGNCKMPLFYSYTHQVSRSTGQNLVSQIEVNDTSLVGLFVLFGPSMLILGVVLYRKYLAMVRRQQIETLEKLWRMNPKKEIS